MYRSEESFKASDSLEKGICIKCGGLIKTFNLNHAELEEADAGAWGVTLVGCVDCRQVFFI